jgi:hypothetical protein
MDVPEGFSPTIILVLNLAGTFVFGLSGGLAAVRAKLDLFGVVVLAAVVGLAGGIIRDVLIGTPPATFRDWRYLAAAAAAGVVCFFAGRVLERAERSVMIFDALGLGLFAVTGATKALQFGLGVCALHLLGHRRNRPGHLSAGGRRRAGFPRHPGQPLPDLRPGRPANSRHRHPGHGVGRPRLALLTRRLRAHQQSGRPAAWFSWPGRRPAPQQ